MTGEFIVALNCLIFLSRTEKATSEEMAKQVCTNASRVRRVLAMLKKGGLVGTKEGITGGYSLLKAPGQVTLGEIMSLTSGHIITYKKSNSYIDMECMEQSGMQAVMEEIEGGMEENCMRYLDCITLADLLKKIIPKKDGSLNFKEIKL